jgi:hypothetical protein
MIATVAATTGLKIWSERFVVFMARASKTLGKPFMPSLLARNMPLSAKMLHVPHPVRLEKIGCHLKNQERCKNTLKLLGIPTI